MRLRPRLSTAVFVLASLALCSCGSETPDDPPSRAGASPSSAVTSSTKEDPSVESGAFDRVLGVLQYDAERSVEVRMHVVLEGVKDLTTADVGKANVNLRATPTVTLKNLSTARQIDIPEYDLKNSVGGDLWWGADPAGDWPGKLSMFSIGVPTNDFSLESLTLAPSGEITIPVYDHEHHEVSAPGDTLDYEVAHNIPEADADKLVAAASMPVMWLVGSIPDAVNLPKAVNPQSGKSSWGNTAVCPGGQDEPVTVRWASAGDPNSHC